MTRKYIVRSGIGQAIGFVIAILISAYVWPTSVADLVIRLMIALLGTAAITALFYRWTSPQERPPDKPVDK